MRLILEYNKSLEENAAAYYEKAKKLKKKISHANIVIGELQQRILGLESERGQLKEKKEKTARKNEWYEKFHWFWTGSGFFVLGGRDATTNELVVKKRTEKGDLVFHTELAGSPFFVLKTEGKKPDETSITEVAIATACYSRAWKLGLAAVEVFYVAPEQVSKVAESGEYISRGSFVVRGKKEKIVVTDFRIAIGKKENLVIGGPVAAITAVAKEYVCVIQGKDRQSDIAKKIARLLAVDSNDVVSFLPAGGLALKK